IYLTEVKRQSDHLFINSLNKTRLGLIDKESSLFYLSLADNIQDHDPLVLFARKKLVKEYNDDKISSFSGDNYEFKSMIKLSSQSKENGYYDDPSNFARLAKQLLKESNFQESINLKIGSRIILTHNHLKDDDPFEFTNGELGTLIDIIIPP